MSRTKKTKYYVVRLTSSLKVKKYYYKNLFEANSSDIKKTWQIIRDLTSAGMNEQNLHIHVYDENEFTNDLRRFQ